MPLRAPTREERTALNRAFNSWNVFDYFSERSRAVMVNEVEGGSGKQIVLISEEMEPLVERKPPRFAGLVIGTLKKSFMPTMAGADLFVRLAGNCMGFPHAVVNEEAEKLVLYGRDIMGSSIVSASESLPENKIIVILNEKREAIGIGKTRFSGKDIIQRGKITITTMVDAGFYLRDEGDDKG